MRRRLQVFFSQSRAHRGLSGLRGYELAVKLLVFSEKWFNDARAWNTRRYLGRLAVFRGFAPTHGRGRLRQTLGSASAPFSSSRRALGLRSPVVDWSEDDEITTRTKDCFLAVDLVTENNEVGAWCLSDFGVDV